MSDSDGEEVVGLLLECTKDDLRKCGLRPYQHVAVSVKPEQQETHMCAMHRSMAGDCFVCRIVDGTDENHFPDSTKMVNPEFGGIDEGEKSSARETDKSNSAKSLVEPICRSFSKDELIKEVLKFKHRDEVYAHLDHAGRQEFNCELGLLVQFCTELFNASALADSGEQRMVENKESNHG